MITALSKLDVITLFVEDLPASKTFYTDVFGLEVIWEDDASAGNTWEIAQDLSYSPVK